MTCRELADFLMLYLDGELPPQERSRFEFHLSLCPDCVRYIATYQQGVLLGRMVCTCPEQGVPEEVPEELVQAILAARTQES